MRKRSLIISLVLLLLIGGGAVAFYLHLRSVPKFSEVDHFMTSLPDSMGWPPGSTRYEIKQENRLLNSSGWLRWFGIRTYKVRVKKFYFFSSIQQPNRSWVVSFVASHPGNIEDVLESELDGMVVRSEPSDAENIRRALSEKFPTLRHVLKVNPKLAPP